MTELSINTAQQDTSGTAEKMPDLFNTFIVQGEHYHLPVRFFRGGGEGPHQLAIVLHGLPGYEQNQDLVMGLVAANISAVMFNYRGAWGTGGSFSIDNSLKDVRLVTDYCMSKKFQNEYHLRPHSPILIGHSMGGFAALVSSHHDDRLRQVIAIAPFNFGMVGDKLALDPEAKHQTAELWDKDLVGPLTGTSGGDLTDEIVQHKNEWDLRHLQLKNRKVLLVGSRDDEISLFDEHHLGIKNSIGEGTHLDEKVLSGDHVFSNSRVQLIGSIVDWISTSVT